jgi:two-component sensor histidine kinase
VVDGDEAQLALPAGPHAPRIARAFVRENLAASESNATIDAVALCVSELVTNALDHAAPTFELRLAQSDDWLRVAVSDATTTRPVPRVVEPSALRGRGLQFVEQTSSRWGFDSTPNGKTVWAEFGTADR